MGGSTQPGECQRFAGDLRVDQQVGAIDSKPMRTGQGLEIAGFLIGNCRTAGLSRDHQRTDGDLVNAPPDRAGEVIAARAARHPAGFGKDQRRLQAIDHATTGKILEQPLRPCKRCFARHGRFVGWGRVHLTPDKRERQGNSQASSVRAGTVDSPETIQYCTERLAKDSRINATVHVARIHFHRWNSVMSDLVVRRLLIDLKQPFPARWNGGDAFRSAFFNALSMSFPFGEQYFIDSVRNGMKSLSAAEQSRYEREVQGFIGQEATHRHIHALFNRHLDAMGFTNEIEGRAQRRVKKIADRDLRIHLAATAATEHFTALFADWILRHPEVLEGAEPRLQTLWQWHSAEESEHRSTAFNIYLAAGGNQVWRTRVFKVVTVNFLTDVMRQTVRNLWHDGSLFKMDTWRSATKMLFARDGLIRGNVGFWKDYLAPDFHPDQHDDTRSRQWLAVNAAQFTEIGRAA